MLNLKESKIKDHYHSDRLLQKIKDALQKAGKDLTRLELKDLAPVDQLHTGGALSSIELFRRAGLLPDERVLDAGCGTGGSSRLLAKEFHCRVTGLDLSDVFIESAMFLTKCTGLEERVGFREGSVTALPFDDNAFDAVLCQHILMNIEDKAAAVKEFYRVLKPGGKLVLHEISQGLGQGICYPVPWASKASLSFLEPWEDLACIIQQAGFEKAFVSDESRKASLWWEKVKKASETHTQRPDSLGPGIVFGENAIFFGQNMTANFKNNAICLVEALFKKGKDD